ncbi:glycerophosphodiester phosphodiesterase family protein [Amycolatopsis taiwanensis]|uniref:glycerophosphodiester phosphodiesterase family protein n=1 Tax=Amycolatopsis taiwanensis TaxID=342230 RepID=UPI003CCB9BBF
MSTPMTHTERVQIIHPYLTGTHPRAFAHRGWHLDDLHDMENSLSSFRRAAAEGYSYIETDVHATVDGVVVVHHDMRLDRTTDGRGPIARQPWSAVRRAKIGGREPVSRLEDVLEELPDVKFNVDIKSSDAVEPFVRVIERFGAYERVAAAAFSDARLARLRRLAGPKLITAMGPRSVATLWANGCWPWLRLGFSGRGAMAQVPVRQGVLRVVDRAFLQAATRAGIEVHAWTINDQNHMRALLDLGVHGIVTDRPDLLRALLIERGAWPPG